MARFERRNHGTGHSYRLDGHKIPGVTTVIGILDKSGPLKQWAANLAAEEAVEHWAELSGLPVVQRLDRIRYAHKKTLRQASVRGTRIHALGEKVAHGLDVQVPDEYVGPVEAYARFLDRWQIETHSTELPVCHTGYRFGGTADGIASSPLLADGEPFLFDVKTGKGVYAETALQLAAYRFADVALVDGAEVSMPATGERAYVAHVLADDVELLPVDAGPATAKAFLFALALYRWRESCGDDPPVGRAVWPETVGADS